MPRSKCCELLRTPHLAQPMQGRAAARGPVLAEGRSGHDNEPMRGEFPVARRPGEPSGRANDLRGSMSKKNGMRVLSPIPVVLSLACAAAPARAAAPPSPEDARAIAIEAYIYGYPLVTMEMTRRVMTNVPKQEATRAPMGQLV